MRRSALKFVVFASLLCLIGPTGTSEQLRAGGPPVFVGISVQPSHLTLHEPVLLILTIENSNSDPVHVDLGRDRKEGLLVNIKPSSGRKVALTWLRRSGFHRGGTFDVGPGEKYSQSYVLNEGYDFNAVGSYEIEVRLAKPLSVNGQDIQSGEVFRRVIEIGERNESALQKRCEEIFSKADDPSSYERAAGAARALSYVEDPVAVPYLQRLLSPNRLVAPIAISGLERIGTPEAVRALASALHVTENNTSVLAKAALLHIEGGSSDPEVKQEIRRVIKEAEIPHS